MELLIVLAIIAIVVVAAAPHASRSDEHLNVESMALNMQETVRYAIDLAGNNGRPVRIVISHKNRYYRLEMMTDSSNEVYAPIEGLFGSQRPFPKDVMTVETDGFYDQGDLQYLIFSPQNNWPSAEITIMATTCGKRLKIDGSVTEVRDRGL